MTIYRYVSSGFCFSEEHKQMCVNFSSILHFLNLIFKSSWRFCWKEKIKLPLLFFFSLSGCPFSSLILLNPAQVFFNLCHHCVRHWPLFLPLPTVIQSTLIIFSKHLGFLWPLPSGKFLPSWLLTKRMPQLLISPKSNPFLTCFFGIFIPYLLLRCPISEISSTYSLYSYSLSVSHPWPAELLQTYLGSDNMHHHRAKDLGELWKRAWISVYSLENYNNSTLKIVLDLKWENGYKRSLPHKM